MVKVSVALDNRFISFNGELFDTYTQDHSFWNDYLAVFDEVEIVGRVQPVESLPVNACRISSDLIGYTPLPYWEGLEGHLKVRRNMISRLNHIAAKAETAILRIPGLVGGAFARCLSKQQKPFAVEVVEDPEGSVPWHRPLRRAASRFYARELRWACRHASAASYVTQRYLQNKYPNRLGTPTATYSSVRLPEDSQRDEPRSWKKPPRPLRIVHVGGMFDFRKGQDVLLEAVRRLQETLSGIELTVVGGGPRLAALRRQAARLGLDEQVRFTGPLPREEVFRILDHSDLFILPTRGEGLPRSMIEAMARGLPVLASPTAGIPEILHESALVRAQPRPLAKRMAEVATDPDWLNAQSTYNLETANEFVMPRLHARRVQFYKTYREIVEQRSR